MNKQKTRRPELLAPAGNMEKFFTALHFGADAVYLAGKNFGLRAFADNFTLDEIKFCCGYAHEKGKKVYVTVNIFADGRDLEKLPDYISALDNCGADALIVSDAGVMQIAKSVAPRLPLHLSTQANCTNARAAEFWRDAGVSRIVAARECGFDDLVQMAALKNCELEIFVHGAMCMAYSGRCLLSSWLSGRGGNKGECVQACRWEWQVSLTEREHPDKQLFLNEDERGVYIMNSRDLCLMPYLNRALETGAVSLKIEGRMKSAHYVGTVVNAYRRALDACLAGSFSKSVSDGLLNELKKTSHRAFTSGFLFGKDFDETENFFTSKAVADGNFVASVLDWSDGVAAVEMRNRFFEGDTLEILSANDSFGKTFAVADMRDENGTPVVDAKLVRQILKLPCSYPLEKFDILRKV